MVKILTVSSDLYKFVMALGLLFGFYFFGFYFQKLLAKGFGSLSRKVGEHVYSQEYKLQRFTFQHPHSPIALIYRWLNTQVVALGLKKQGVTPFGFFMFWGFMALGMSVALKIVLDLDLWFGATLWIVLWVCILVMTRVVVSGMIERREMQVMDAIDLIVPELHNGTKNAIVAYQDNFPPDVRDDFKAFISNLQERGFTFEAAMLVLADALGPVFRDFAEKSIYYEKMGEKDLLDIFSDIVETNRLRRQLREENNRRFSQLMITFVVSTCMCFAYFGFTILTDDFSRKFWLTNPAGNVLLLVIFIVVFGVLAFITSIKSRTI